jgi:hypothetical protein
VWFRGFKFREQMLLLLTDLSLLQIIAFRVANQYGNQVTIALRCWCELRSITTCCRLFTQLHRQSSSRYLSEITWMRLGTTSGSGLAGLVSWCATHSLLLVFVFLVFTAESNQQSRVHQLLISKDWLPINHSLFA